MAGAPGYAQVPGTLVPGRQKPVQDMPAKSVPPSAIPSAAIGLQPLPDDGGDIQFVLRGIRLTGAQAIAPSRLSSLWTSSLGQTVNIGTIYKIANAITAFYAQNGYALSFAFVPEQEITGGIVTIRVVEGFVDRIVFKDGDKIIQPPELIQRLADHIRQSKPLKTDDLERYLLLINDQAGYNARAVFIPSKTENASDLIVNMTRDRVSASASLDNHLARTLGRWHGEAAVGAYGLFTQTDALEINQGCGQWCDVYSQYGIRWRTLLNDQGTRLSVAFSQSSETPIEGVLVPLDFHGKSQNITFDVSHPVIRSRQSNLDIGGSLGAVDNYTKTFAGVLTRDRVRAATVYTRFDYADDTGATNVVRFSIAQGLPMLNASDEGDPLRSRSGGNGATGGSSDFLVSNLSVSRLQPLDHWFPAMNGYALQVAASGQKTLATPLLSVTQCYYGGTEFGRGYESGALSGDNCAMGSVEFRKTMPVRMDTALQLYAFGDAGYVTRKGGLAPGEKTSESARSVGLGARMLFGAHVQGEFQVGWPLNDDLTSNRKNAPRSLLSVSVQF